MTTGPVVFAAVLCAVVGMPPTASDAGSYGAVVEKGFRDCATAPESAVVICFQSPSVTYQSRGMFLQAWRAADVDFARWDSEPATLFVREVSVATESLPPSRRVLTYMSSADLVTPEKACREDMQFQASDGVVGSESSVSARTP
jgi:hypothetical protein